MRDDSLPSARPPRTASDVPAVLWAATDRHAVRLVDLSRGGAKVRGLPDLARGTVLVLEIGAHVATARLRWLRGATGGIAFDSPLSRDHLARLVRREAPVPAMAAQRAGRAAFSASRPDPR